MARLVSPQGVVVDVSDDGAERLTQHGYKPAEQPKKAPAKSAASKSEK